MFYTLIKPNWVPIQRNTKSTHTYLCPRCKIKFVTFTAALWPQASPHSHSPHACTYWQEELLTAEHMYCMVMHFGLYYIYTANSTHPHTQTHPPLQSLTDTHRWQTESYNRSRMILENLLLRCSSDHLAQGSIIWPCFSKIINHYIITFTPLLFCLVLYRCTGFQHQITLIQN